MKRLIEPFGLTRLIAFAMILIIAASLSYSHRMRSVGQIKTVGLLCSVNMIDWGMLEPSQSKPYIIKLTSTSNVETTLNMTSSNYSPVSAGQYLSLTWNREGYILKPKETINATLTLTVNAEISGITSFSFDIEINAEER